MKIVFLLTQDVESPSGLGRYYPLARELAALGHTVAIYALHPNFKEQRTKRWVQGNLRVIYVAPMHVIKTGNTKTYYSPYQLGIVTLRATWALSLAALKDRPDLIWIGKPHPMNGIAGILSRIRWGSRLFLDCDDDETNSGNFRFSWQRSVISWFEHFLPKYAQRVTTNTFFTLEKMVSRGIPREKMYYLPNGVDLDRFYPPPEMGKIDDIKTRLGLEGKKIISYIGSMSLANHAVDLLIEAFRQVYQTDPDTRLLLVGSGEDYQSMIDMVGLHELNEAVIFTGRISPKQVSPYYRISHVTVDPVYNNDAASGRSPLKMFEAWACGVPFITSDVGDRITLAGKPPAVLFVEPGNAQELAKGILYVINNPDFSSTLSKIGLQLVKKFTWSHIARNLNIELDLENASVHPNY